MSNTNNTAVKNKKLMAAVIVGLMSALVYLGNYLSIKIPSGAFLTTRIHLGNSMCLLAGLLFGRMKGGLASGIGAALYDLFDPVYVVSAPYTFFSKFAMGFTAGHVRKHGGSEKKAVVLAAVLGQLVYIILYLVKSYFTVLILGGNSAEAWAAVGTNAVTSTINGILAVVISVPLYFALDKALAHTSIAPFIKEKEEKKGWLNPLTAFLTVFSIVVTAVFSINLAATKKIEKAEAAKEAAYQQQIDDLQAQIDDLAAQLGVEVTKPVHEEEE
ncbi:MAG: ECF transporter S component [Huintestinicola sp.]